MTQHVTPGRGAGKDFGRDFWSTYPLGWLITTTAIITAWRLADANASGGMVAFLSSFGALFACLPLVLALGVIHRSAASRWPRQVEIATRTSVAIAGLTGATILMWSCSTLQSADQPGSGSGVPAPPAAGADRWPKSYSSTTCTDWLEAMTNSQRRSMAGDVLVGLRERNGGSATTPSSAQIAEMTSAVTVGCEGAAGRGGLSPVDQMTTYYVADKGLFGS